MRCYCLYSAASVYLAKDIKEAGNYLARHPEMQLRNLKNRDFGEGASIYDIRMRLMDENIPFKRARRDGNCTMACCCACTASCAYRCPQDVLYRAYLMCSYLLESQGSDFFEEAYKKSPLRIRYLYDELTSETPKYEVLHASVTEIMKLRNSYMEGMQPDKLSYAPVFDMETVVKSHGGEGDIIVRKVVDSTTGRAKLFEWPSSGVCPFCEPSGVLIRSRIKGRGDRKSKNWKEKFYENEY